LKSGYYSIVYMPCFNGFMIEETEIPADVYMYLDGEFIPLLKGDGDVVTYEGLEADKSTNVTFTDNTYLKYLPITLDDKTNPSIAHVVQVSGMSMLFFDKEGTYNLIYDVKTGVLSIVSEGGDDEGGEEEAPTVDYLYYLSVSGGTGGNQTLSMQVNSSNPKEVCYKGVVLAANCFISVLEMTKDASSYKNYGAIAGTDPSIAQSYGTVAMVKLAGTYDVYFDTAAKTVKLVAVAGQTEVKAMPKEIYISTMKRYAFTENPDNPDELCYLGLVLSGYDDFRIRDTNDNYVTDITLAAGTKGAQTNGSSVMVEEDGTYNIYVNKTTHEVRIVVVK